MVGEVGRSAVVVWGDGDGFAAAACSGAAWDVLELVCAWGGAPVVG